MDIAAHIDELERQGAALAEAAARAGLAAEVPPCPGWTVRDLLGHVGGVHRWAATFVRGDPTADLDAPLATPPSDVRAWFVEGHRALVAAVREAPADLDCATFLPGAASPLAFWVRRQAHETAVHRADAEAASGQVPVFAPAFAADGIDELLCGFFARRGRLRSSMPRRLLVAPDDIPDRWVVTIGPEGCRTERAEVPADATMRGPASGLYLALWNRPTRPGLVTEGDPEVLALWRRTARVVWG